MLDHAIMYDYSSLKCLFGFFFGGYARVSRVTCERLSWRQAESIWSLR